MKLVDALKKLGFEDDGVADLKHHGGYDKAVCVYSADYYPYWERVLSPLALILHLRDQTFILHISFKTCWYCILYDLNKLREF